jgi:hypothetical protein
MKIYEDSDIRKAFEKILSHIESGPDVHYLRTLGGSLSVAIFMRITQLKSGIANTSNREEEIEKLEKVSELLVFTLNSSTASEIEIAVTNAYKAYSLQ